MEEYCEACGFDIVTVQHYPDAHEFVAVGMDGKERMAMYQLKGERGDLGRSITLCPNCDALAHSTEKNIKSIGESMIGYWRKRAEYWHKPKGSIDEKISQFLFRAMTEENYTPHDRFYINKSGIEQGGV